MSLYMGLDIASSRNGVALVQASRETKAPTLIKSMVLTKQGNGLWAAGLLAHEISQIAKSHTLHGIAIEGYSLGSKFNLATMVETGTVVRYFMMQSGYNLLQVSPSSLKKFVCKGSAKKEQVMLHAFKNWGFTFDDNNECDAACLAVVAAAYHGDVPGLTKEQTQVIGALKLCN